MTVLVGIAYAFLGGLAWGFILFASKRYFSSVPPEAFIALTFGAAAVWYAPITLGSPQTSAPAGATSSEIAFWIVVTVVLAVLGLSVMFRAISMGDVSYVTPISKINPVFVVPIEVFLLGELLEPLHLLGIVVATFAVYLANVEEGSLVDPLRRAASSRPARLALASAIIIAVFNVSQRFVLQELGVAPPTWVLAKLVGGAVLLFPFVIRSADRGQIRSVLPKFFLLGGVLAFGEHFISQSFALIPASVATPIVNIQTIVAVLLGGIVLREGHLKMRLSAAIVAILGVLILAIA